MALSTRDLQQQQQQQQPQLAEPEKSQPYPLTTARTFTRSFKHRLSKTQRMKVYHFFSKDYDDKREIETQTSSSMVQLRLAKQEQEAREKDRARQAMFDVERWRRTERAMRMSDAPIVRQVTRPVILVPRPRHQSQAASSSSNNTGESPSPYLQTLRSRKVPSFKVLKVSRSKVAAFGTRRADRDPTGYRLFQQQSERRDKPKSNEPRPRWRY